MLLVSILGDSISTYAGYNPGGYQVFYDEQMQIKNGLNSVYDTWWAKVNQALGAYLCVNNSYSGSRVSGKTFPSAYWNARVNNLHTGMYKPSIILIYIGFNDFGNGIQVTQIDSKDKNMMVFYDAYENMVMKIHQQYPDAKIVCGTLMRTIIKHRPNWIFPEAWAGIKLENYNNAIRDICKKQKCYLADLNSLNIKYETLDGTHPTKDGHICIANAWITCLKQLGILVPSLETCIKAYNANKNSKEALKMVYYSLIREDVLIACDKSNGLVKLTFNNQEIIPIFTTPKRMIGNKYELRLFSIRKNINALIVFGKDIIINPYSDLEFYIPYKNLNKIKLYIKIENKRRKKYGF